MHHDDHVSSFADIIHTGNLIFQMGKFLFHPHLFWHPYHSPNIGRGAIYKLRYHEIIQLVWLPNNWLASTSHPLDGLDGVRHEIGMIWARRIDPIVVDIGDWMITPKPLRNVEFSCCSISYVLNCRAFLIYQISKVVPRDVNLETHETARIFRRSIDQSHGRSKSRGILIFTRLHLPERRVRSSVWPSNSKVNIVNLSHQPFNPLLIVGRKWWPWLSQWVAKKRAAVEIHVIKKITASFYTACDLAWNCIVYEIKVRVLCIQEFLFPIYINNRTCT